MRCASRKRRMTKLGSSCPIVAQYCVRKCAHIYSRLALGPNMLMCMEVQE